MPANSHPPEVLADVVKRLWRERPAGGQPIERGALASAAVYELGEDEIRAAYHGRILELDHEATREINAASVGRG